MNPDFQQLFRALVPEGALVLGALAVLGLDLSSGRNRTAEIRLGLSVFVALIAVLGAVAGTLAAGTSGPVFGGALVLDKLTAAGRIGVLVLAAFTLAALPGNNRLRSPAEFVAVLLFATVGFTLMAAAAQLLTAFLGIELASLSLYVLAGFDRDRFASAEAALKYFLVGAMSAAFLLFGFSLLYGATGTLEFNAIARHLAVENAAPTSPLLLVAVTMVLVAFGFKAAAAPFHLWAPDVYQGAPSPAAALVASASKLAGIVIFMRLLWSGLAPAAGSHVGWRSDIGWLPVAALVVAASLVVGNIGALAQTSVRRLLAYSAIAHAGALLLGVMMAGPAGPGPVIYYAFTYGLATVGAFGIVGVLERTGTCDQLEDLAGLARRSPLLAGCLAVFVLSLAGIPPLAGFFGKFAVFAGALSIGGVATPIGALTIAAIGFSAVGLYYYLLILKQALVLPPVPDAPQVNVPASAAVSLVVAAALIVVLGVLPSVVLGLF